MLARLYQYLFDALESLASRREARARRRAREQPRSPLPLPTDRWASRWLVFREWDALHRVAEIAWEDADGQMIRGQGVTCCGLRGRMFMPGVFSRMGLARCPECCRAAGVAEGEGNPWNQGVDR